VWLEAGIHVGLPLGSFAFVRYDAGRSLPQDLPVVDLSGKRRTRIVAEGDTRLWPPGRDR
jgi:hypothetical protein